MYSSIFLGTRKYNQRCQNPVKHQPAWPLIIWGVPGLGWVGFIPSVKDGWCRKSWLYEQPTCMTYIIIINYCCLTWAHFTCRLWPKNAAIPPRTSRTASAFPSAWVRPSRRKRRKLPKYSSTHLTTINNHTQDLSNSQQNHSTWNFPGFIASKARFWGLLFRQRPTSPARIDLEPAIKHGNK